MSVSVEARGQLNVFFLSFPFSVLLADKTIRLARADNASCGSQNFSSAMRKGADVQEWGVAPLNSCPCSGGVMCRAYSRKGKGSRALFPASAFGAVIG